MQYSGKVKICGVDTSKLPRLKQREAAELMEKIKNGDEEAKEKFIFANLRLVLSVVQRFLGRSEAPDDLFQVGAIGLIKAVKNFDLSHNVKFSTYAVPMIIGEIRRFLRDNNSIRVSRSMRDLAYKAMQLREGLSNKYNREITNTELAKALDVPLYDLENALEAVTDPISIFEPVFNDGSEQVFILDQISDVKQSDKRWTEQIALREALTKLDKKEYNIIKMRYFSGKTQMEIASEIGISQAQVSRLEKSALQHIKKLM
ncbi:MAG: RNA polymerase sporulation sigma factor SigG [Clostridia bacterium]|nr:RNA polymerase sporulation sigma factor SigG [Clostridia bacterium]